MFNDQWMHSKGYLDKKGLTAKDITQNRKEIELISVESNTLVKDVLKLMAENDISQIPVTEGGRIVGAVNDKKIFIEIALNIEAKDEPIKQHMQPAFPFVDISTGIDDLAEMLKVDNDAVLVKDFKLDKTYIITRYDILDVLAK
jgi:cystathionine beta-synthase